MSPSNRRGRRVPSKGRGARFDPPGGSAGDPAAGEPGSRPQPTASRSANRAAKRDVLGVRAKTVRGGRVTGRSSRSYNPAVIGLAIGAVVIVGLVFLLGNPLGSPSASASAPASVGPPTPVPSHGDGSCPTSQPAALPAGQTRTVTIVTNLGTIVIKVDGALEIGRASCRERV